MNSHGDDFGTGWTSNLITQQRIDHPGGILKFAAAQSNANVVVGLTGENSDGRFSSIEYALLLRDDGNVQVYEKGVAVGGPRPYRAGNLFRLQIVVTGGLSLVSYVLNDEEFHSTHNAVINFPLAGRVLLSKEAASIINLTISTLSRSAVGPVGIEASGAKFLKMTRLGKPINPHVEIGFNFYRSTDPNLPRSQWERLNQTLLTETSFVDRTEQPGVAYYYYVTSVNAYGLESPPSDVIFGGVKPAAAPPELTDVVEKIKKLTPELIEHLRRYEDDLLKVNPRIFEHLIAEFFASWGFDDVRLVGTNARTSADIYVVKTVNPVGVENRYFVEVKRWKHKVGIEVINQVLGAMIGEREQFGWHAAMIVSVAGFTEFEKWDRQQLKMKGIELKEKSDLLRWLQNYKPNDNGLWLPEPPTLL